MVRLRVALPAAALAVLAVPFLAAVADRDSIDALLLLLPALAVSSLLFLVARPRAYGAAAAALAVLLLPYAFVTALGGDGRLFPREGLPIWAALALTAVAAALPRRS